ncbi:MAG: hypothetical protein MUC59_02695 [Saprospiraceae bacterium]|jgi:hypothetical protein|nr:hypothetical protein [Saprospiraceae bacterium]
MKINLLFSLLTALFFAVSTPSLLAATSSSLTNSHQVHAAQKAVASKQFKKEKRGSKLKQWWQRQVQKISKLVQRVSLGFVGFLVMLVGGLFIVLGIVIPYVGVLFLVIGIIIAFVGLLLWLILSRIGVRVESGEGRRRNYN